MKKVFLAQRLGSTNEDLQGERLPKSFLENFARSVPERMLMHNQHDLSISPSGYVENLQVVPDPDNQGEWILVGDVYSDHPDVGVLLKGFSISGALELVPREEPEVLLHLPFSGYTDEALVAKLSEDEKLLIRKWIKKSAEPAYVALVLAAIAFTLRPVWDDIYKTDIAPKIRRFLKKHWPELRARRINLEHVQVIDYQGSEISVWMIGQSSELPERLEEASCIRALKLAESAIREEETVVSKVVLIWKRDRYVLQRLELAHGDVRYFA